MRKGLPERVIGTLLAATKSIVGDPFNGFTNQRRLEGTFVACSA